MKQQPGNRHTDGMIQVREKTRQKGEGNYRQEQTEVDGNRQTDRAGYEQVTTEEVERSR